MRFSDLKKLKPEEPPPLRARPVVPAQEKPEPRPAPAQLPAAPPPSARQPEPPPAAPEKRPAAEASSQASRRRQEQAAELSAEDFAAEFAHLEAKAKEVYSRLLLQADAFFKAADQPYCEKYEAVLAACALASGTLKTNPYLLNCTMYSTADDYLKAHTVNTLVVSLAMGLEARLEPAELSLLGFCAMAHDVGMTGYSALYGREERLGEAELAEMALHAEAGAAKLDRIVDLDHRIKERAKRIILQVHERPDGTGYPDRLSDEETDPLAQIISVADSYEAMTHPRSWREAVPPPDAVKELISREGGGFNAGAVKLLIAVISIYPPGSLVMLSTGETARVLRVNKGLLSRPVVEIALATDFSQTEPQLADLKFHTLVSIDRSVTLAELRERNPRYAARLELDRWWTNW